MEAQPKTLCGIVISLFLGFSTSQSQALPLSVSFGDPVEDHLAFFPVRQLNPPAGVTDLVGLTLNFDNSSGNYEINIAASPANPFVGGFVISVGLFNPDTGTTAQDPAWFEDVLNDFYLDTPSTMVTLTGSSSKLLAWEAGDRVAPCEGAGFVEIGPCQGGLGLPDGVLGFGSGSYNFIGQPTSTSRAIGTDAFFTAPFGIIVSPIPEPETLALLILGLVGIVGIGFQRRK